MKKILGSVLIVVIVLLAGCTQKTSDDFYQKYSVKLEKYQGLMNMVKNQDEYDKLLEDIRPVFEEMDAVYSAEFNDDALEVYAKFAGLATEFNKAADTYRLLIQNKGELTSDSLLLPAAMACFYAKRPDEGVAWVKQSLQFGEKGNLMLKDYMLAMTLDHIINTEGTDAAKSFISEVRSAIQSPLARFDGQAKAMELLDAPAPELVDMVQWINTSKLTSESLQGKVYLIDFWATWCNPCRMSTPKIKELYEKYKSNKNVQIIGITTTYGNYRDDEQTIPNVTPEKERELIAAYVAKKEIGYPVGIAKSNINSQNFGVSGIPAFYLMGKDGTIKKRWVGFVEDHFVEMDKLIAEELN